MKSLQQLFISGQFNELIDRLKEDQPENANTLTLIAARLSGLKQKQMRGIISYDDGEIALNRISYAIQHYMPNPEKTHQQQNPIKMQSNPQPFPQSEIKAFVKTNIHSRKSLAMEAKEILKSIRKFEDDELEYLGNTFDATGVKREEILKAWSDLVAKANSEQSESVENQVIEIRQLLSSGKNKDIHKACRIMSILNPGKQDWKDMADTMKAKDVKGFIKANIITEIENEISNY